MKLMCQHGGAGRCAILAAGCLLLAVPVWAQEAATATAPVAAPAAAPVAVPAAPSAPVDPVIGGVQEALTLLQSRGLQSEPAATRRSAMEAVLRAVDPQATILDRAMALEQERRAAGIFTEIGVGLMVSNGMVFVSAVRENSPAAEQQVEVGDQIVQVDGSSVTNLDVVQATRLLRGAEGQTQALVLARAGAPDPISNSIPLRAMQVEPIAERREMPNDLCYLRLNGLMTGTGQEVLGILRRWAEARRVGVVLDLRGAGGTDLESATVLAGLVGEPRTFLFSLRDPQNREIHAGSAEPGAALGMPLVVLVDEQTTRASELLAAALKGSGRGVILVGRPTAGDPEVRERIALADGEWAYLAVRKLVVGNGEEYSGARGVEPHVLVATESPVYATVTAPAPLLRDRRKTTEAEERMELLREHTKGDAVLTRAVDILLGLRALNLHGYGRPTSD